MPKRDIIVVGASAGGVEVLKTLVAGLPRELAASVLVVLHISPSSPSRLPEILRRCSALSVATAEDGEPLVPGRIYVAPPGRHLVVEPGVVRLTSAPRENHNRPAIDPLFRSAALAYGPRVIGVVLSGRLDDGTAGLWAVKDRGGLAVVQDPEEAAHPDMPRNALAYTAPDHLVEADGLAPLLARLVDEPATADVVPPSRELQLEVQIAMASNALRSGVMELGPASPYSCPECHGVLLRVERGGVPRFRCHTGHAYSVDSLLASVTGSIEETLWSALRAVEESILLLREAADHVAAGGTSAGERRPHPGFERTVREAEAQAELIRGAALRQQALSLDSVRAHVRDSARDASRGAGGNGGAPHGD